MRTSLGEPVLPWNWEKKQKKHIPQIVTVWGYLWCLCLDWHTCLLFAVFLVSPRPTCGPQCIAALHQGHKHHSNKHHSAYQLYTKTINITDFRKTSQKQLKTTGIFLLITTIHMFRAKCMQTKFSVNLMTCLLCCMHFVKQVTFSLLPTHSCTETPKQDIFVRELIM